MNVPEVANKTSHGSSTHGQRLYTFLAKHKISILVLGFLTCNGELGQA